MKGLILALGLDMNIAVMMFISITEILVGKMKITKNVLVNMLSMKF